MKLVERVAAAAAAVALVGATAEAEAKVAQATRVVAPAELAETWVALAAVDWAAERSKGGSRWCSQQNCHTLPC